MIKLELSSADIKILEAFKEHMNKIVIPRIVRAIHKRQELANISRQRIIYLGE